jgi:sec-independent protein translocase protein TatA
MDIGPAEILIVLLVVVMIFGVGKLPELGSSLGKGIREFRNATREDDSPPRTSEVQAHGQPPLPAGTLCQSCGASNSADSKFCTSCGSALSRTSAG